MLHALTRTVETLTGIYLACLTVRVVRRRGGEVTIDVSPPGVAPRYYTIPATSIGRGKRNTSTPAECGTRAGVRRHNRRREPLCHACSDHRADHRRARRIRDCRTKTITVPVDALGAAFDAVDSDTKAMLCDTIGTETVDALVDVVVAPPPLLS